MHYVPDVASLAQGLCVPQVWWGPSMAAGPAGDGLRALSSRDLDHGRHAVRKDAQTAESVVQGHVAGHQPEDGSKSSGWAATRPRGCGFTSFVPPWFARGGIVSKAVSRSTKPMWAAPRRALAADKPRRSPLWSSRRKRTAIGSDAFGWGEFPTSLPQACLPSSKKPSWRVLPSTPTAGSDTTVWKRRDTDTRSAT